MGRTRIKNSNLGPSRTERSADQAVLFLTLERRALVRIHHRLVRSLRYLTDSNCSFQLPRRCINLSGSVSLGILAKTEGYVTGQHFRGVHLAVSEEPKLPSFDAGLFEILPFDFGTIPKISCHPMSTIF